MRKNSNLRKITAGMISLMCIAMLAGCGQDAASSNGSTNNTTTKSGQIVTTGTGTSSQNGKNIENLEIHFGDAGKAYAMHLENNDTAKTIAGYVGSEDWRLPIYHFNDYEGYEFFQYYDIPSRYKITGNPVQVTSVKAGEVYYSEPNRIILIYQDAEISQNYTKIGTIDYSDAFVKAVEENPVLEGWGNKIVLISAGN